MNSTALGATGKQESGIIFVNDAMRNSTMKN